MTRFKLTLAVALGVWGCGSQVTVPSDNGGGAANGPGGGSTGGSGGLVSGGGEGGSLGGASVGGSGLGGAGGAACCDSDEVYSEHACLPTTEVGCRPSCDVGSCPDGWTCDTCAAVGPCGEEICTPTCVLAPNGPGMINQGDLRIAPTQIQPGVSAEITVRGSQLYVGALWYDALVGGSVYTLQGVIAGGPCEQGFVADPLVEDLYPVWVSQYGGNGPLVLAGFLNVSQTPLSCRQPGYSCAGSADCCQTTDAPVSCTAGQCMYADP